MVVRTCGVWVRRCRRRRSGTTAPAARSPGPIPRPASRSSISPTAWTSTCCGRPAAAPPSPAARPTALRRGLAWQHQERGRTVARRVQTRGDLVKVDVRKLGIWMVALGGVAMSVGIVADAVRQADDPTLAAREGIFDLSGFPHALFFGGLCAAGLGLFALLFGSASVPAGWARDRRAATRPSRCADRRGRVDRGLRNRGEQLESQRAEHGGCGRRPRPVTRTRTRPRPVR